MNEDPSINLPLPHAEGSEKFVLSSFMKSPDIMEETPLEPEIFYMPSHRVIYRQLLVSNPLDLTIFVQTLHDKGTLDAAGGPSAVYEVYTYAVGPHFQMHLDRLRDRHARRMAIAVAVSAQKAAFDCSGDESARNYLDAISGPITAIHDYAAGNAAEIDTKALARQFLEQFERRMKGIETPMGIPYGISEVDQVIPGIHPGQMVVISGPPGGGKSTLATQIAGNLADDGIPTLYLAYERGALSVYSRTVIQRAAVRHQVVKDPKINPPNNYELRRIRDAVQTSIGTLHFPAPQNRKSAGCLALIRRYHRMHGIKVAIIDQIGLLRGDRQKGATAEEELRLISNGIQEIAHELGITVIVLCQVNSDGDTMGARAIEQDADLWFSIILERNKAKSNFGEHQHILVAKDSHYGKQGEKLELILDRDTLRFVFGKPQQTEAKKGRFEQ